MGIIAWSALGNVDPAQAAIAPDHEAAIDPATRVAALADWEAQTSTAALSASTREVLVKKGDNLMGVLLRAGISGADARAAVAALGNTYNPRRNLKTGDRVTAVFAPNGDGADSELRELLLPLSYQKFVSVRRQDGAFKAEAVERKFERNLVRIGGEINSSLFRDGTAAGIPAPVLTEFIRVFSYDIDFQRELRRGDRFEILFERVRNELGEIVSYGDVALARLTVGGDELTFYRYETSKGHLDYFNAEGQSVRKSLMRTPVDGARLTSGFGQRRHPILGYNRMHSGVDFAAARGTPVYAAGDGRIVKAGRNGAYGNYIRIRHNSTYQTAYAHMSRIAKGMKSGIRVKQGQIIGYVGSTGRSTGPHLHYEVHEKGKAVNPARVKPRTGEVMKGEELARFEAARKKLELKFAELGTKRAATVAEACGAETPKTRNC